MPQGIYKRRTRTEYFWSKVNKKGPTMPHMKTRCWVWTGCIGTSGYGGFRFNRLTQGAHRFAFFLKHGRLPKPCGLLGNQGWMHA